VLTPNNYRLKKIIVKVLLKLRFARIMRVLIVIWAVISVSSVAALAADGELALPVLPQTGQIISYDTVGNEIDFHNSGQDGEYQRGRPWPLERFVDNGDGTITDKLSSLIWLKDGSCLEKSSWHSAASVIADFNRNPAAFKCASYDAAYRDWSLPLLDQLATLINGDESVTANYLNLAGFSSVQPGRYWTGSRYLNSFNAWTVALSDGALSFGGKMESHFLLAVRPLISAAVSLPEGSRFVDNGDGTVSDKQTNLMWLKDAGCLAKLPWQEAIEAVAALNSPQDTKANCRGYTKLYSDWVLPNRHELRSLVDYSNDYPALAAVHPFQGVGSLYWSSTSDAAVPKSSFVVDFYSGAVVPKDKTEIAAAWPVRYSTPVIETVRKVSQTGIAAAVAEKFIMDLAPASRQALHWPPVPRFFNNGDGTSMDSITGLTWLTDGSCFQKMSWPETFDRLAEFNDNPQKFACEGYDATFGDWTVPSAAELQEVVNPEEADQAAWLNSQGLKHIRDDGNYWSATETMVNLYYSYVINFQSGTVHHYPKSLKFFLWPHRVAPDTGVNEPLLNITVNSTDESDELAPGTPFTVSLFLYTFGLRIPGDFWLWYDTPDGQEVWLSGIKTWQSRMTPFYQGPLFNLKNYELLNIENKGIAPGDYTFHFAVDLEKNGLLDNMRFENQVVVTVAEQ